MKALLLLALSLVGLVSCITPMDTYSDPMYSSGGGGGYYGAGSSGFMSSGVGFGGGPGYYGGGPGYYGGGAGCYTCQVCRRSPCACSRRSVAPCYTGGNRVHDDHHDDHDRSPRRSTSSRSNSSSSEQKYYFSGTPRRGQGVPEGNHTREWFKERGYQLDKLRKR
jgi:hypothetical protein